MAQSDYISKKSALFGQASACSSLLDKSESKERKKEMIKSLLGENRETKALLKKYSNMVRVLPHEFDIEKIKKLRYYV